MQSIIRHEWRGTLLAPVDEALLAERVAAVREAAAQAFDRDGISALCLYRWKDMLFIYTESLQPVSDTRLLLAPLFDLLAPWPEAGGPSPLADMYPVFWHSIPEGKAAWLAHRTPGKTRVGRIAFLYPEKLFSYVCSHQALVHEGLLSGDRYQFISLHENVLFSYYEEPRQNVNLSGSGEQSALINDWLKADPESHFDHDIIGTASNFLVIEPLLLI